MGWTPDADGFASFGSSWRQVVAGWPHRRRERYERDVARLVAVGWNEAAARFVAYERAIEGDEEGR